MRLLPDFTATARLKPYEGDFKGATLRLSNRSIHDCWRLKKSYVFVLGKVSSPSKKCCIRTLNVSTLEESEELRLSSVFHIPT